MKFISEITLGFKSVPRGVRLILDVPKIRKFAIVPVLIDIVVIISALVWGLGKISGWVDSALGGIFSEPSGFLYWLFYVPASAIAWLAFFAALYFFGYLVYSVLAAPFNSLLAEAALAHSGVIPEKPFNFKAWVAVTLKMVWAAVLKSLLFMIVGLLLFAFSFIPVVGVVGSFAMVLIMVFDCADFSFEARLMTLRQRLKYFRRHFNVFLGAGIAVGLTFLIPGLNFLMFPAIVVGMAELMAKLGSIENVSR